MRWTKPATSVVLCLIFLVRMLSVSPSAEIKVYRSVETEKKRIALTFDDGPHPSLTPKILQILAKYDIPATFFMVGQNVINYPTAAKQVILAGHEVGNHTFTHPHIAALNEKAIFEEIGKCEDALEELCEYRPHLLRTPQGALTPSLERCLADDDYILVFSGDYANSGHINEYKNARKLMGKIVDGIKTKNCTICVEIQKTPNNQSNLEKEKWSWRNHAP